MNLLRSLFHPFDRRVSEGRVEKERRGGKVAQLKSVNGRINSALDDLNRTVSMSREEFCKMIQSEGECPKDKK